MEGARTRVRVVAEARERAATEVGEKGYSGGRDRRLATAYNQKF